MSRILAVSDLHGSSKTFRRLMEKVNLTPKDSLYVLGDVIDRGPDSKGVIDLILGMLSEGFDIRPIRGNHEEMLLLAARSGVFEDLLEWLDIGGAEATLQSYGVDHPKDIPEHHLRFLESLPLYRVTKDFIFVHAGLDCSLGDPFSKAGENAMLSDRSGTVDQARIDGRKIVAGHTTRTLDQIKTSLSTGFLRIDNGVCLNGVHGKGSMVCVDLGSKELFIQENLDTAQDNETAHLLDPVEGPDELETDKHYD